jgi:hypothetical protein
MNRNHRPRERIDNNNVSLTKDKYRHHQLLLLEKNAEFTNKIMYIGLFTTLYTKGTPMTNSVSV